MRRHILLIITLIASLATPTLTAQRKITPIKTDDKKKEAQLYYYDRQGKPLETPVRFLSELDTVTNVKSGSVYPLLNGMSFGINFADAILMAAGQKYGSFDVWADLSIHNWFFPVVELGIGFGKTTPKDNNFTYKALPSFYAKVGINYNFLYKSNPDYQFYIGMRAGFSSFRYEITGVDISSDYWGENQNLSLPRQSANAFFGEVLLGLKVKIAGPISMGWNVRMHKKFGKPAGKQSNPWFIPGYGASSPLSLSFSVICNIPVPRTKSKEAAVAPDGELPPPTPSGAATTPDETR